MNFTSKQGDNYILTHVFKTDNFNIYNEINKRLGFNEDILKCKNNQLKYKQKQVNGSNKQENQLDKLYTKRDVSYNDPRKE